MGGKKKTKQREQKTYCLVHPITGRKVQCSHEVYQMQVDAKAAATKQQEDMVQELEATGHTLANKIYEGQTKDLEIAVKFNQKSQVNHLENPQIDYKGALKDLSPETKQAVENGIYQFMLCVNEALGQRTQDMENELKKKLQPAA